MVYKAKMLNSGKKRNLKEKSYGNIMFRSVVFIFTTTTTVPAKPQDSLSCFRIHMCAFSSSNSHILQLQLYKYLDKYYPV